MQPLKGFPCWKIPFDRNHRFVLICSALCISFMLPPDLCYIPLFHLAWCCSVPIVSFRWACRLTSFCFFKQPQGHELCFSCTILPTNACKSPALGMCVLNFFWKDSILLQQYTLTLCPSSNLRLENIQNSRLQMLRHPRLFKLWLPIYPHASGWYQLTVTLLCFI